MFQRYFRHSVVKIFTFKQKKYFTLGGLCDIIKKEVIKLHYNLKKVEVGRLDTNCYILKQGDSRAAVVIDPGDDFILIKSVMHDMDVYPALILLTHGHFDHIMTLDSLCRATGAKVLIHQSDLKMPTDTSLNASDFFGLDIYTSSTLEAVDDGDKIMLADEEIRVIHTPGHTPGSVVYDCGDFIVCGDTLFTHGYGRYDLYGGDGEVLFQSLRNMKKLDRTLTIYPGHGGSTNLYDALKALYI